jgi:HSP20 family protein
LTIEESIMETEVQKREDMQMRGKAPTRETGTREGRYFEPAVDIFETPEALVLVADVPGTEPQDIQTDLRDNLLTITATVKPLDERWKPVYEEYAIGHFMRQFRLGQQIDQSKISGQLKDGVLTLTLPKVDTAKPRQIKIQTS